METELDNLVREINGVTPSDFVMKRVNETVLADYFKKNKMAQNKLFVRDWLLAEAFPATTLPAGANHNWALRRDGQNIGMDITQSSEGCMTDVGRWPPNRNGEWRHSDYKDVPYQHVKGFYTKTLKLMTK